MSDRSSSAPRAERRSQRRLWLAVVLLLLAWAGWRAADAWWTTDDAFISFRYAQNLVEGRGLVFNAGERVEGYTNPLWTLWSAAGLALGFRAEPWANAWSLGCYLLSILMLALGSRALARERGDTTLVLPLAAAGAALHREWQIFATSGLETAPFTMLLLAGFCLTAWHGGRVWRVAAAGLVFALAALTRHDGALPALIAGLYLLGFTRKRWSNALVFGLCFAALWAPFTAWRLSYYGEFFPNSYYAKSGYLAWYSQGLRYLQLYLEKYWILALGPLMIAGAWARDRWLRRADPAGPRPEFERIALAAAMGLAYLFYVVRVGGDFMFGRFLIPATPFLLIVLEAGWIRALPRRPAWRCLAAGALLAAMLATPPPVTGSDFRYGVANEWTYYSPQKTADLDHSAAVLGEYFAGLPARIAFYGDEARIVYKARFAWAIESSAGLNDPTVARQELDRRGRVGHEKYPSARYLVEDRRVHFTFSRVPRELIRLDRYIPRVFVRFDEEVYGRVLHWDPVIMEALRARGAGFVDFVAELDRLIARLEDLPPDRVAEQYERIKRFYFDPVGDRSREAAFLRRLERR